MKKDMLRKTLDSFEKHVRSMSPEEFKAKLDGLRDDPLTGDIYYALTGKRLKPRRRTK
jgi:hypothetical protein